MSLFFRIIYIPFAFLALGVIWAVGQDRLFYDAVRAEASGDIDNAINLYLEASKIDHSANLHGNLANLYFKKEQFGRSILHFNRALILNPSDSTLKTNLGFASDLAGIPLDKSDFSTAYFSSELYSYWLILFSLVFWIGLLTLAYISFFRVNKKSLIYILPCWILILILCFYGTHLSSLENRQLERKIIVYSSNLSTDLNKTNLVPLRRFAGESNSANTNVLVGQSLFIDLNSENKPRSHQVSDNSVWYLVRDKSGKKKGWIRENEFGWVIPPKKRNL